MIEAVIICCLLVLFRVGAFLAFLPPMAGRGLPNTVKIGLAVAVTIVLAPQYAGTAALQLDLAAPGAAAWLQLASLAARETALGAGLAWLFGLCLVPARIGGAWIAQEMGLNLGELTSPMDQQPSSPVSQGLEALGVLLFFALNIHHVMFFALGRSFVNRPLLQEWSLPSWQSVVQAVATTEQIGLMIVAPVGILLFVTSVTLLITMRTAPQFNFMSYGMTLRLIAGIGGIFLFLPDILSSLQYFMTRTPVKNWS
jgi:flagellar biosynthetic protein FliR